MAESGNHPPGESEDRLREVGRYSRVGRAHDHGLVVLSMGLPYWLMPLPQGGYGLYVEREHEAAVRQQLERFEHEHLGWPPQEDSLPPGRSSTLSIGMYALLIWGVFYATGESLLVAGSASEVMIRDGEWWRVITSLTLHADWAHLLGNTAGGLLFFGLVFRFLGFGTGWILILASGALGNLINAFAYSGSGHRSIGASTAVFGSLGILLGFRLLRQFRLTGWRWPRQLWVPLAAGVALLGFLGSGGERTDILAHCWGFVAGAFLGAAAAAFRLDERWSRLPTQRALALLTILVVVGAWWLALR